jgi:PPOX class probable F420-dependent enzyme
VGANRRAEIAMTSDEAAAFLAAGRVCVLVTIGPDGAPDPLPMWFVVDDAGRIVMRTYAKSQKVRNLERDPRASALVEEGERYAELRGVQLTGTVRLDPDPELIVETWTGLMVKYESFDAEQAAGFRRIAAAKAATQVALVFEPTQVVSWDHRKLS